LQIYFRIDAQGEANAREDAQHLIGREKEVERANQESTQSNYYGNFQFSILIFK